MELRELKNLRKDFDKYLNYKGINLWKISETAMYTHFLNNPRKIGFLQKIKHKLLRKFIKFKNSQREKESIKDNSKKEVIMVVSAASHVATLKPIIKKMNVKIIRYDAISSEITKKSLEKDNTLYNTLDSYIDKEVKRELKKADWWLFDQWKLIKKDRELREKIGLNYDHVMEALRYFMKTRKRFLETIRLIEIIDKICKIEKNKIFVSAEDNHDLGRILVGVGRKNKVKSLTVQHGLILRNPVFGEIVSDKMAVHGKKEADYLVSMDGKREKIEITGQPRFDEINKKKVKSKKQACKEFGLDFNKKIVIFAAQPLKSGRVIKKATIEFIKTIEKIKNRDDFEFIIKLHPRMSKNDLPEIQDKNIKIIEDADIYSLLNCCDVLITCFSTVGLEAVFLGYPVISIEIGEESRLDYGKEKVGISLNKKGELENAINRILYNNNFKKNFQKNRKRFIENFAYKLDGRSTERIVSLINKMILTR